MKLHHLYLQACTSFTLACQPGIHQHFGDKYSKGNYIQFLEKMFGNVKR